MHTVRALALVSAAVGLVAFSSGQITGPVPLAWRWSGSTTVSPTGVPAFSGDNVYVSVGNRIYCLDKATGNKKWQWPLLDGIDGVFVSTPVIVEGMVVAAGTNRTLYAVDANTGEAKWSYVAPGGISGTPTVAGRFIAMNVDGNSLMAVGFDGQPVFTNPERVFEGISGNLVANGTNILYTTGRREMYAMNMSTRRSEKIATFQSISQTYAPILVGNTLYVCSGNYLIAMNPSTGSARWQKSANETFVYGPGVSPEGIAAVTERGDVHIFDTSGSRKMMTTTDAAGKQTKGNMIVKLESRPVASPSPVGKLFAIPTINGALTLIDPADGKVVWSFTIRPVTAGLRAASDAGATTRGNEIISIPAAGPAVLNGNSMYVLAADGSLLAFDNELGVDLTGPNVRLIWPQQGLQVSTSKGLELYLQITDEASGINDTSLKVTVNGDPVKFDFGRDGILSVLFGPGFKNNALPDGRAVLEVTVTDWMGNSMTSRFSFTVDNTLPPLARPGGRPGETPGQGGSGRRGGGGALGGG